MILIGGILSGCTKGCIDEKAINYDPDATLNKGCVFPTTVTITSIGTSYINAEDPNGEEWDADGSPDKIIVLSDYDNGEVLYSGEVSNTIPYIWTINQDITFKFKDRELRVTMYDQDPTENVIMADVIFKFNDFTGTFIKEDEEKYPDVLNLSDNFTGIDVYFEWSE